MKFPLKFEGYVILDPRTGQYSRGGTAPDWGKRPKVWSGIGPLKNHLNQFVHQTYGQTDKIVVRSTYNGCIIINALTGDSLDWSPHKYILEKAKALQEEILNSKYHPRLCEIEIR